MRRSFLYALMLTASGCSGAVDGASLQEQKLAAANAKAKGNAQGDACAQHRWYGDGVCDTFCADTDSDCVPDGEPVVCALFIEEADERCGRTATDACRFQDPDCKPGADEPNDPIACALVSELPNGRCSRPVNDHCRFQDPDCNTGGSEPSADCDTSKIMCQTFAAVICPDGQTPTVVNGCYGPCVAKEACAPVACPAIALAPDGVCSGPSSGPCPLQDPDCASLDCDPRNITCEPFGTVTCPEGQVPSVVNACYGACVPKEQCAPVPCLAYLEESDGVCSRPANDPCRGQDPDCSTK